jgi:hypothetical protein
MRGKTDRPATRRNIKALVPRLARENPDYVAFGRDRETQDQAHPRRPLPRRGGRHTGGGRGAALSAGLRSGVPVCTQGLPTGPSSGQTLVIALVLLIAGIVLTAPWRLHWLIRRPPPSDPPTPSRHLPAYPFTPRRSAGRHNAPPLPRLARGVSRLTGCRSPQTPTPRAG